MNHRIDRMWILNRRARARRSVGGAMACGALLVACSGHDGSIDLSQTCTGPSCDAGSNAGPDAAGNQEAGASDSSPQTDGGASTDSSDVGQPGTDASGNQASDPCPSVPLEFNCSSTCGAGTLGECSKVSCDPRRVGDDQYLAHLTLPAVLRTPEKPGIDKACGLACIQTSGHAVGTDHRTYGMAFEVSVPFSSLFRVRVDPPWWIEWEGGSTATFCPVEQAPPDGALAQRCLIESYITPILIWTDDPNAPARNIYVEAVDQNVTCN